MKKLFAIWLLVVSLGFGFLFRRSIIAGEGSVAAARWPEASSIARDPHLATLLLFVHPGCACSQASKSELERLLPALRGKAKVEIVSDLETAAQFGARTSGQVLLYSATGELVFHGGITPERGHEGNSRGREMILDYFERGSTSVALSAPVFGCALDEAEGG